MIRKDLGNYMRWKTIQQQGPCEGRFNGICQSPEGLDVPMRQLAHRSQKDITDAQQRLVSMGQDPNKRPGHKTRLYDSLNRPHAYRNLCPACHGHHDKHMFDEGYQEPKWVLDNKYRQLVMDRNKNKRKIKRHGGIVKSINEFIRKFDTSYLPHEGTAKYKPQMDARTRLNNKLKPHEMSNRKQEVNPASSPPMGFGQKTNPADHVVDNYVPVDKTHAFKYRGRTYDAGKMSPEEISDILAEMEQQI